MVLNVRLFLNHFCLFDARLVEAALGSVGGCELTQPRLCSVGPNILFRSTLFSDVLNLCSLRATGQILDPVK
jgi:hypothetical protein